MSSKRICEKKRWKVGTKITDGKDIWEITAIGYEMVLIRKERYETTFSFYMEDWETLRTCELHKNCNAVDSSCKTKVEHKNG